MAGIHDQAQRVARFRSMVSTYDDGSWRAQAACGDVATDLFFPVGSTDAALEQAEVARAVCSTCPVRLDCLRFAVATNQQFGIWGGCDEEERRVLRRKWRAGGIPFEVQVAPRSQPAAS